MQHAAYFLSLTHFFSSYLLSVHCWTSAFLLAVHRLCGVLPISYIILIFARSYSQLKLWAAMTFVTQLKILVTRILFLLEHSTTLFNKPLSLRFVGVVGHWIIWSSIPTVRAQYDYDLNPGSFDVEVSTQAILLFQFLAIGSKRKSLIKVCVMIPKGHGIGKPCSFIGFSINTCMAAPAFVVNDRLPLPPVRFRSMEIETVYDFYYPEG